MPPFGDDDPEDGYDASDPPHLRLANFLLRLDWIRDHLDLRDFLSRTDVKAHVQRLRDDIETLAGET